MTWGSNMGNIKTLAKEILRWSVIAVSGGCGVWLLIEAVRSVVHGHGDWVVALVEIGLSVLIAIPCFAVAYFCLRRQYRKLYPFLGMVGSIAIFAELSLLPEQLGVRQFLYRQIHENHFWAFLGLLLALLIVFVPIYAAAWFYRFCHCLAYSEMGKKPKTRATRWLVWLGILCFVVLPMIPMLVTFNSMVQSSTAASSSEAVSDWIRWMTATGVIGTLLMFLGLVRRQPIPELEEETSTPEAT